ncbi:hypothetical protein D3874_12825 [Oleomonas cavernae]|uniref:DUF3278 domain-containing protein n=1 Tax=Oleomonas cavernae TaxID=2320859 RepID=A0A418WCN0_9PROT|nr:hypothetical protein [Oleomonas cavernae]RJF87797.1 hypothetical protein D3874_12825 [Oleomonas cavernae]
MSFVKNQSQIFFRSVAGQTYFFPPAGRLGKGYLVTPENKIRIETAIKRWFVAFVAWLIAQFILLSALDLDIAITIISAIFVIFIAISAIFMRRLTQGLEETAIRMSINEAIEDQARKITKRRLYYLLGSSLFMTAASIFAFVISLKDPGWNTAYAVLGFFLFSCGLTYYVHLARIRSRTMR